MSFCVALQSAIFYLAACTPCRQARHHQKSLERAKEERKEKERLRAEHPETYQHPDPFNTNPYWSEEIMMGPRIQARKYNSSKNTSQRGLNSAGNDQPSVAGSSMAVGSTNPESSPTAVPEDSTLSQTTSISEDWNKKRYQREDEELWGHEFSRAGHRLMDAIKQAGSSAHRRIEASLGVEPRPVTDEDRYQFYFAPKNPPVNDYHPPIVRQRPIHQDGHKWMLQPPPAAKIMEGKAPVSRSGSMASHVSRRTTMSEAPTLGRLLQERAMEAKFRSDELPSGLELTTTFSRSESRRNTASIYGRRSYQSARSRSLSLESSDASEAKRRVRRTRPPVTPEVETSEDDEEFYQLKSAGTSSKTPKTVRRSKFHTVTGSRGCENDSTEKSSPKAAGEDSKTPRSPAPPLDNISDVLSPSQLGSATNTTTSLDESPPKPTPAAPLAPQVST
ncbi:hypothetical protein DL771_001810 [Monosporascus sp. 5C6A]|nr:hypothetical protein DL771_001810 [Monosporascus sp. 5C6A]